MTTARLLGWVRASAVVAGLSAVAPAPALAQDNIDIGASDVAGFVTSANGREAGVWVIAETADLPTKFVRIVVTDERGRYLIPEDRKSVV